MEENYTTLFSFRLGSSSGLACARPDCSFEVRLTGCHGGGRRKPLYCSSSCQRAHWQQQLSQLPSWSPFTSEEDERGLHLLCRLLNDLNEEESRRCRNPFCRHADLTRSRTGPALNLRRCDRSYCSSECQRQHLLQQLHALHMESMEEREKEEEERLVFARVEQMMRATQREAERLHQQAQANLLLFPGRAFS